MPAGVLRVLARKDHQSVADIEPISELFEWLQSALCYFGCIFYDIDNQYTAWLRVK